MGLKIKQLNQIFHIDFIFSATIQSSLSERGLYLGPSNSVSKQKNVVTKDIVLVYQQLLNYHIIDCW